MVLTKEHTAIIQNLIKTSIELKSHGHDMFVRWSPHTYLIDIDIHINGWHKDANAGFRLSCYFETNTLSCLRSVYDFIDEHGLDTDLYNQKEGVRNEDTPVG